MSVGVSQIGKRKAPQFSLADLRRGPRRARPLFRRHRLLRSCAARRRSLRECPDKRIARQSLLSRPPMRGVRRAQRPQRRGDPPHSSRCRRSPCAPRRTTTPGRPASRMMTFEQRPRGVTGTSSGQTREQDAKILLICRRKQKLRGPADPEPSELREGCVSARYVRATSRQR